MNFATRNRPYNNDLKMDAHQMTSISYLRHMVLVYADFDKNSFVLDIIALEHFFDVHEFSYTESRIATSQGSAEKRSILFARIRL